MIRHWIRVWSKHKLIRKRWRKELDEQFTKLWENKNKSIIFGFYPNHIHPCFCCRRTWIEKEKLKRWKVMQKVEDGCLTQQNWKWDHMIKSLANIENWKGKEWKVSELGVLKMTKSIANIEKIEKCQSQVLGVLIGKTKSGSTWSNRLPRFNITPQECCLKIRHLPLYLCWL